MFVKSNQIINMIAIVNYNEKASQYLSNYLDKNGFKNCISDNETTLLNSSRIILPHCTDIKEILKRLHLKNLYSALKMYKKPILGIGNGMVIMCENILPDNLKGLGFFECQAISLSGQKISTEYQLNIKSKSAIVPFELINDVQLEDLTYLVDENELTCYSIQFSNKSFAAHMEKGYYFGTIINLINTGELGMKFVENFNNYP